MELLFKKRNKTMIVQITGEIDHYTSTQIRSQLESALYDLNCRNIIFFMENVSFMDSSGIGMFIGRYKQLQAMGGRIAIVQANGKTAEILHLSGLTKIIPLFEMPDEAIRYAEGRGSDGI